MNLATTTLRALPYMTLLGATIACGSSATPNGWGSLTDSGGYGNQDGTVSGDDGGSGTSSGGSGGGASSGGSSSGGGNGCPTSCRSNADCQNSCPAVTGGGTNCCDLSSGTCFMNTSSSCPSQSDAAAE